MPLTITEPRQLNNSPAAAASRSSRRLANSSSACPSSRTTSRAKRNCSCELIAAVVQASLLIVLSNPCGAAQPLQGNAALFGHPLQDGDEIGERVAAVFVDGPHV